MFEKNLSLELGHTQKNIQGLRFKNLLPPKVSVSKPLRNYQLLWASPYEAFAPALSLP